ncbi:MAG: acyl-CoA thioesterase [Bacteriovoracaceae bacterium]|jgi:acyl-CoA hydrolase|nr:acyl-CoA thioesterase [Bacteriovoracaceae bacterium]
MKTPKMSEIQMRQMVMPGDTNKHGTIFGGTIMSWIDIAAAMCAERHCNNPVVTVHVDDIHFISPIKVGHHVFIRASINYVGNTSMIVGVKVQGENPYTGKVYNTTKAYLTFVALDEYGKPMNVPSLKLETDDDKRRYENALKRKEAKKNLDQTLELND